MLSGQSTQKKVFEEFFNSFEGAAPGRADGVITWEEFRDYYADLSATIPHNDDSFVAVLSKCWGVQEKLRSSVDSAERKKNFQNICDLIVTKIRQRYRALAVLSCDAYKPTHPPIFFPLLAFSSPSASSSKYF